jgi:hypothetical protein
MFLPTAYDVPRRKRYGSEARLPIRMLLSTRGAPQRDYVFNIVGMVRRILGSHEDARAAKVMLPFIYAGDATDESIADFIALPWLEPDPARLERPREDTGSSRPVKELRLPDFPAGAEAEAGPGFDIVHFADRGFSDGNPRFPLALSGNDSLAAGEFCDALVAMRCRLLILQTSDLYWAERIARWTIGAGGPSVLTVNPASPAGAERYFVNFYLGLLHNEGLSLNQANQQGWVHSEAEARLHLAADGDSEWRFDGLRDRLQLRAHRLTQAQQPFRSGDSATPKLTPLFHASERSMLQSLQGSIDRMSADPPGPRLADRLQRIYWDRESGGVVPLTEIADELDDIDAASDLFRERLQAPAPRVLNANFAGDGEMLAPDVPLRHGRRYELLVDIGPQWDQATSIVQGRAAFPVEALPASGDGHRIDVVFASDDFAEPLVSGALWLPDRGRSIPMKDGRRGEAPGPLRLALTPPPLKKGTTRTLRGRLCLFFENNLLQSATVRATLAAEAERAETPNSITVDYVLSGGFHDVETFRTRSLEAVPGQDEDGTGRRQVPVGFNLTLNDDGGGGHRIILPSLGAPVSVDYDPAAAADVLTRTRTDLLNLFWKRDDNGDVVVRGGAPVGGLDDRNGKDRPGFLRDLLTLAKTGSALFGQLFNNVRGTSGRTAAQLINDVRVALAQGTVIQIARTGSANYVFPWSLVYDFPIDEKQQIKFCRVVKEWDESSGRRDGPLRTSCPEGDHRNHQNRICPYGFWGVRHNIEQPPSGRGPGEDAPWQAPRRTGSGGQTQLQAAMTSDASLDAGVIARHLQHLGTLHGLHFEPPVAADWDDFIPLLETPQLLYFLCHGEYDPARKEPYIGIGLRDQQTRHRIYANDLAQAMLDRINHDYWRDNAPLIIINGCHTADLGPGQVWSFVQPFAQGGAGGVIGTEVSIRLPVATEAAETLLTALGDGEAVGDAIQAMRWTLLDKGNLLGLAYTPYCLADLRLLRS